MAIPKITAKQIVKSVILTSIGVTPGLVWFFNARKIDSVVVACLGAFIGFAFSLPGVSAARVLKGTAAAIVANNVPRPMQGKVFEAMVGESGASPDTRANKDDASQRS